MEKGIVIDESGMTYSSAAGNFEALRDVNLSIAHGEFICLLGPSGCGKTTLLNTIAGFLEPTTGALYLDGAITGPGPDRGVVFQQYAVFPWLTVKENVQFGLRLAANRKTPEEIDSISEHFIDLVNLRGL